MANGRIGKEHSAELCIALVSRRFGYETEQRCRTPVSRTASATAPRPIEPPATSGDGVSLRNGQRDRLGAILLDSRALFVVSGGRPARPSVAYFLCLGELAGGPAGGLEDGVGVVDDGCAPLVSGDVPRVFRGR